MKNLILLATVLIALSAYTKGPVKKAQKGKVSIQLIRNATLKLNYNGKKYLVDPSLPPKNSFTSYVVKGKNLNPTVDLTLPVKEITKDVNALLVTHVHEDHFYFNEEIMKQIDTSLPLFAQPFDKESIKSKGFSNVLLVEDQKEFDGTTIIRTTGQHGPDFMVKGLGEVSGYILKAENYPTVYIVGDCIWDDVVKATIKKHNPDIIVTNSGGAQYGGETILMDAESTIELAKYATKAKLVAVHMEALDHCTVTRNMLAKKAKEENVNIAIPKDGETIKFKK